MKSFYHNTQSHRNPHYLVIRLLRQQGAPDAYLHGYAYDGVWVLARAVSLLTEQFRHRKRHSPDRNLSINQAQKADMLLAALKQTQFEGVTVSVSF